MPGAEATKVTLYQTEKMALALAEHLSERSRGLTRGEIAASLGMAGVDETTVYRWLAKAKDMGLVKMEGMRASAKWFASDDLRREKARQQINAPIGKRPVVTYDELWLREYTPNQTFYLSLRDRNKLHARCPVGSAPISKMDQHDLSLFLCGLPYASSRMEGNSYDFLATVNLIERNMVLKSASKTETQMILNHHQAVRFLIENINHPTRDDDVGISGRDIRTVHALLSDNLLMDPGMSGKIRSTNVTIQYSSYKPLDMHESLASCFNQITQIAGKIEDPFEQAFFLTVHLPYLQPFVDCNKRTARVACNIPLLRGGVVPVSWMDVEPQAFTDALLGVYELNEVSLLAEVFVDGYLRSIERFHIMSQAREPDEVVIKYAVEIRQAVRNRVLNNDDSIPSAVADFDAGAFMSRVEMELEQIKALNPANLFRNKLREGDVDAWMVAQGAEAVRERVNG